MTIITLGQIITALVVVILILLQERGTGAGGAFGGGGGGAEFYQRRRGIEKILFIATIATAGVFTLLSILNLML